MYRKLSFIIAALCLSVFANAQDEHDALLLGRTYQYGTSRNLSLSGATGSLGADFGAINNNPAGIGLYRKSELTFTPNILSTTADGEYQNTTTTQSETKFNFNQAGIVFAKAKKGKEYSKSHWKTSNFAVGFNRLANLHTDYSYTGTDNKSSFIETFAEEINAAGGYNNDAIEVISEAAYGAIKTDLVAADLQDSTIARSFVPYAGGLRRGKTMDRKGGINELAFTYGANYEEKLFIGVTLGLPIVNYNETEILTEDDVSGDTDNDFKYVDLVQELATDGNGVNLKLGTIYRASKSVRFGLALHTPTWYSLTDVSNIIMESHTENLFSTPVATYQADKSQLFDYTLQTPMKAIASATTLFGQQGFLSADVEYINYNGMRYNYGSGFESAERAVNRAITQAYKDAINFRLGGEVRIDELAIRAGYAFYGSPYENYSQGSAQSASAGAGYRGKNFFLDVATQFLFAQDEDITHTLARTNNIPTADINTSNLQISLTAGFRF